MDFRGVYMLSGILLVISASLLTGEDFDNFITALCSDPNKPNKCAPSAKCHGYEDFCTSKGEVESCFPGDIAANDTAILEWCRNPDTIWPDPTCKWACFSKFEKSYNLSFDHVTRPTVDSVTSSSGQDHKPCDCPENSADYTWAICVIAVLAILLIGLVIGNIVFWVRQRKTPRQQNPSPGDAATGQQNPTPDDAKTQGRDTNARHQPATDKCDKSIGDKACEPLLGDSGDNENGTDDPQGQDAQQDQTSSPSSAAAGENSYNFTLRRVLESTLCTGRDTNARHQPATDKCDKSIGDKACEPLLGDSGDNENGTDDPQGQDAQQDQTSSPSSAAAGENSYNFTLRRVLESTLCTERDTSASPLLPPDNHEQDIEMIEQQRLLAGSGDNGKVSDAPQGQDSQQDQTSSPPSAAAGEDSNNIALGMGPFDATPMRKFE